MGGGRKARLGGGRSRLRPFPSSAYREGKGRPYRRGADNGDGPGGVGGGAVPVPPPRALRGESFPPEVCQSGLIL